MTRAPTRPEVTAPTASPEHTDVDAMLAHAVDEAARLLEADGAMVYLVDGDRMRFAVDAGIRNPEAQQLIRDLALPIGVGLFGHAVASRELVVSGDYRRDKRFPHSPVADRIAAIANMRSMAAAPLLADGEVLGALGAYSSNIDDFSEAELALLRALADHAAAAIANQRLIERLASSQKELARRVDAQRTLSDITARMAVIRDPDEALQSVVEAARRLIGSDGSHLTLMSPDGDFLRPTVVDGGNAAWTEEWLATLRFPVDGGINGLAAGQGMVIATENYLTDPRIPHEEEDQRVAQRLQLGGVAAAPLRGPEGEVMGTLAVSFEGEHRFSDDELELLQALADQGAIAIANARLADELRSHGDELAHRVDAQRTLAEMAAQLTSLRDPSAVLTQTLKAAVRLLKGDGGQIGMVETDSDGTLKWGDGHSLVHDELTPFTKDDHTTVDDGVSGRALRQGRVSWTADYVADESFPHDRRSDRIARRLDIRAVIAAPLIGESGPIGAIGVYAERPGAFDRDDGELLGLLADQAAIVLTNARLYEQLRDRVDAQRALAAITAEIAGLHDPAVVLQRTAEEALRLLRADTAIINPLEDDDALLGWPIAYAPAEGPADDIPVRIGEGISGRAMAERQVLRTGDYLADPAFEHTPELDEYIRRRGMASVMTAPLISSAGGLGALTVQSARRHAFDEGDAELLRLLADQAAIAITNARLYDELGEESAALARQTDSQQRLLQINERLLSTLEPASVLELVADGLKSVVWYDYLGLYRVEHEEGILRPVLARDRNAEAVLGYPIPRGQGVTWWSVEHRQPVLLNDALADPRVITIPDTPDEEEAIIIVPLISGDEVIGAMNIARRGGAEVSFSDPDFELVQLFAGQAAVAITNARLYEQLRERADAQKALAEIAAQIASLHEPQTVLDRAVADAARLLGADRAQINLLADGGAHLDRPIAAAPVAPSPKDVVVPIGSGIAGMAAAERRVRWTGDYLADDEFPHDEGDARIEAQGIRSMMSAPLVGPDRLIGTITVQATEMSAFGPEDAELLKLLADQAAITLTNARLYAEVEESERRYRHLVDNSPDIVWSVDADGSFTFFSDSLEARTGWNAADLLGRPFTTFANEETMAAAVTAWERLRDEPNREQRLRLDLPLPDGRVAQTEVAMTGTIVDGRFAGAHGSVRDISERERLEGDLRGQAAELAASQERAHLARELHDSVTQALFSMGLTLRTLELLLGVDDDAARTKVGEMRELQKDALAEMRTLIFELRPSSLESDGLVQALRTHATAVQRRTGLVIVVDAEPIDRLELAAEEALYRIGQEALHNVVKHANASNATIRIAHEADRVRLTVTDDGGGFEADKVPRGHLGLIGMRQRVDLVGGELRVQSEPGSGTTIEATVPAGEPPSAE